MYIYRLILFPEILLFFRLRYCWLNMSVNSGISFILSVTLTIVLFCGMQMYKQWFTTTSLHTVLGGYLSSLLFTFLLTAVGNLEASLFDKTFQSKLFPEVFLCLLLALSAASTVHRVCVTTGILFSIAALYYMNKLSQTIYATPTVAPVSQGKKRKGN